MRSAWRILAAAMLALLPAAAWAEEPDYCSKEPVGQRCLEWQASRLTKAYRLPKIEDYAARGDKVRRAFFQDGYGSDKAAVTFIRAKGHSPVVRVNFVQAGTVIPLETIEAPVSAEVWNSIAWTSYFERALVSENKPDDGGICIHPPDYLVEASVPAYRDEPAHQLRGRQYSCDESLAGPYAYRLAKAAVASLPACALLTEGVNDNFPWLLRRCGQLHGDTLAAAEVMKQADAFTSVDSAGDLGRIQDLFRLGAALDWAGAVPPSGQKAPELWIAEISKAPEAHFSIDAVTGETGDKVRLTGYLTRYSSGDDQVETRAKVEQIWGLTRDGWEIERATVGRFERLPY